MKVSIFITTLLSYFLFSCSAKEIDKDEQESGGNQESTVSEQGFIPKEIAEILKGNLPETEDFSIQIDKFNTLETKKGAIIHIPPAAFEGDPASVTIRVKEIYSIQDMIFSGMGTVSDKGWLVTSGMIYLQAYSDGKPIFFKNGKSAIVNIPASSKDVNSKNKLFNGENSAIGIEWRESNENKLLDYIIPFPISYLNNDVIDYYLSDLEPYKDKILCYSLDPSLKNVKSVSQYNWWRYESLEKYKNSLIVTREFQSMFNGTAGISNHHEVVDFYFKNNELPLWKVDSMYWPEYEYKDRRNGKVIKLDYDGLDLDKNGFDQLIKNGLTEELALLTVSYYEMRNKLIKKIEEDPQSSYTAKFNTMLLTRMGWFNIDKYLELDKDPISLNISVPESSENAIVYLVDKENKMVIRAKNKGSVFYFGKDENEKIIVPDLCSVYVLDARKGELYFKEIYLDEGDQQYEVKLDKVEKSEFARLFESMTY